MLHIANERFRSQKKLVCEKPHLEESRKAGRDRREMGRHEEGGEEGLLGSVQEDQDGS